jgi:alpha-mannosidase
VFAITVAKNDNDAIHPAAALYDDFTGRRPIELRHEYAPAAMPPYKGVDPSAAVVLDRRASFTELRTGPPSPGDYADQAAGNGVRFHYVDRQGECLPHRRSGAEGTALPRLNDGQFAQNHDDTDRCVWWDGEGRFVADLQRGIKVAGVTTYSWHRSDRAPQFFSLWGSDAPQMPDPNFAAGEHTGWTLLAVVDTREIGMGGVHVSSVEPTAGLDTLGIFRHLLWILPSDQGTFFTEVDVRVTE